MKQVTLKARNSNPQALPAVGSIWISGQRLRLRVTEILSETMSGNSIVMEFTAVLAEA